MVSSDPPTVVAVSFAESAVGVVAGVVAAEADVVSEAAFDSVPTDTPFELLPHAANRANAPTKINFFIAPSLVASQEDIGNEPLDT